MLSHLDDLTSSSSKVKVFHCVHPVQVPRWDAPWWLPRPINLLKLSPRFQVLPPQPINEYVFYPSHKETLFAVIFEKIGGPQ